MTPYDISVLEEAMNAIKEEIVKDLSESVIIQNQHRDYSKNHIEVN